MIVRSKIKLGELFSELGLSGNFEEYRSLEVARIAPVESATSDDLVFIAQERYLSFLETVSPAAFVVSASLSAAASQQNARSPVLLSQDAMLAFAKASRFFQTEPKLSPGIHPTAVIDPTASVAPDSAIGPFVVVGEGAQIAAGAVLHSHVQVGARSKVGKNSVLFSGVKIYHDVILGDSVRIHANSVIGADGFGYVQERTGAGVKHVKIHHTGGVKIGNGAEIGSSTTIDRGTLGDTIIGDGCIIDNQVQVGHNCVLEEGVILCGCVALAGSVTIEKFALVAGLTGVNNKVRIGTGAQVAGMTAVTGNVPAGAKWGGIPAMPRGEYARLQVLLKRLPELFQRKKGENI